MKVIYHYLNSLGVQFIPGFNGFDLLNKTVRFVKNTFSILKKQGGKNSNSKRVKLFRIYLYITTTYRPCVRRHVLVLQIGLRRYLIFHLASPNQTSLKSTLRKRQPNREPGSKICSEALVCLGKSLYSSSVLYSLLLDLFHCKILNSCVAEQ